MESGEKTERATPKKRKEARESGQVRKSTEVVTAAMMLAMFAALSMLGMSLWEGITRVVLVSYEGYYVPSLDFADTTLLESDVLPLFIKLVTEYAIMILPIFAVAFVVAAAANIAQVGFMFSTKALGFKASRLNPLSGIKRMFSIATLFELAKSIAKVAVIGTIAYMKYMGYINRFAMMPSLPLIGATGEIAAMVLDMGYTIAGALLVIAAADYVYQWFKYEKDLRMTKYEVKMEFKQQEGDPQVKGRIKQKQRQMAMMRMMQDVPTADVVITNPTHYAVALRYDESVTAAPFVVAKGVDYIAQRIKEVAKENGVEIVENVEVARALYSMCDIGGEVPLELYQAVAEILAFVYRKKRRL